MSESILKRANSDDPDFRTLITELDTDLRERNGDVMDIYDEHNIITYTDTVVIAYLEDEPVGCGCFKHFDEQTAELKRMFVKSAARGNGISARILHELEEWARELGYEYVVLETGSKQIEAHGLYRSAGYTLMPAFGPYIDLPDSICYRKALV